jgi:ABC-type branched-subunit amino acid transport system substrate-binding protein
VAAARKLVDSDQVLAIQGGHATGPSAAALPYLEQSGVPYVTPFGGAVDWYMPTRPLIFGAQALFDDQARVLGRWAGKDGFKNILVIHSAVAAFEKVALQVEPGVRSASADAKVELMPVKIGTTDYVPIALEVASKKPDAVVFIGAIQEYVALAKEVKQQGITTQLFTYGGSVANDTVELGGDAVEGTRSVSYSLPIDSDAPAVKEYRDALAKYVPEEKPDYASLLTFALAKIAVEAIRNAKEPLTRDSLVESLNSMQDFDTGIIGKVSFGPDRHLGTTSVQPVELKGGKWVTVGGFVDAHSDW